MERSHKRSRKDTRRRERSRSNSRSRFSERDTRRSRHSSSRSIDQLTETMTTFLSSMNQSRPSTSFSGNAVPNFNPEDRNQSIEVWCNKIDEMRQVFKWSEDTTIYFALSKLKGLAEVWYRGLTSIKHTWDEWKGMLRHAFPSSQDHCELLEEMLKRKKRVEESYATYYFEKMALINGCKIKGVDAVSCLIGGLTEIHVKTAARAGKYGTPEELYSYLRTITDPSQPSSSGLKRSSSKIQSQGHHNRFKRPYGKDTKIKCFRCGKEGHISRDCKLPPRCKLCRAVGHEGNACTRKDLPKTSNVS